MSRYDLENAPPHEFEPDFWFKDRCGFEWNYMMCGYSLEDHIETFGDAGGRGGAGRNWDGTWPASDGRGCPLCGAIRNGGHGGGCPNTEKYDERGNVIR